jgi:hypothetical protein
MTVSYILEVTGKKGWYEITTDEGVFTRKGYPQKSGNTIVRFAGHEVEFDKWFTVVRDEVFYESKVKRASTEGMHKGRKQKAIVIPEVNPIKVEPVVEKKSGEVHHEKYEIIKTCLESNIPVYLAGPAGSGKNHTVEQIAKELGWNFYFSNSVQQEYKLTGFIDAGGEFHDTEFYKACNDDNDCIFFLDEMDASIPEVLVLLNAAIANGYFEFPNGRVNLKHIHFVAAGNTVGSGADEMYTGRMVLDQATLDRFAIIEFDYSLNIEMAITKGNTDLVEFIHSLRKQANENGIRATFSYRCMTMVTKLEKAGMDMETILTIAVFKGLDKDTINTFNADSYTRYDTALRNIKVA